jgi:hypothetical protein
LEKTTGVVARRRVVIRDFNCIFAVYKVFDMRIVFELRSIKLN